MHKEEEVTNNKNGKFEATDLICMKGLAKIQWMNLLGCVLSHFWAVCAFVLVFSDRALALRWQNWLFYIGTGLISAFGIIAGAHRLWSHHSYKARLPLRIFLMVAQSMAFQLDVITWVKWHRCHHKWVDTDADPYNAKRGFFFSHMGWQLIEKHPDFISKAKTLDLADLHADPVLRFQKRNWPWFGILVTFILPTIIPPFWGECIWYSFVSSMSKYVIVMHLTACINSFAHLYGDRPYDKDISPRDNKIMAVLSLGEGWHNYHHCFPSDYRGAEKGYYFNVSTIILDMFAVIGLVHTRKTIPEHMVERKKIRSGDSTEND